MAVGPGVVVIVVAIAVVLVVLIITVSMRGRRSRRRRGVLKTGKNSLGPTRRAARAERNRDVAEEHAGSSQTIEIVSAPAPRSGMRKPPCVQVAVGVRMSSNRAEHSRGCSCALAIRELTASLPALEERPSRRTDHGDSTGPASARRQSRGPSNPRRSEGISEASRRLRLSTQATNEAGVAEGNPHGPARRQARIARRWVGTWRNAGRPRIRAKGGPCCQPQEERSH